MAFSSLWSPWPAPRDPAHSMSQVQGLPFFFFSFFFFWSLINFSVGCSWRPRSVGNDARSFNYRSRRTSVRKADRKKKDGIRGEARSSPRPAPLPIWTGGARKLKKEQNIARLRGEAGNLPPLCNQLFLETFRPPSFFIVDQPVREREKVRRQRASEGSRGEITAQSGPERHAHTPSTLQHTHTCPLFGPRPWTRGRGLGRPPWESLHRARRARPPRAPTRARLGDLLRVPERGICHLDM